MLRIVRVVLLGWRPHVSQQVVSSIAVLRKNSIMSPTVIGTWEKRRYTCRQRDHPMVTAPQDCPGNVNAVVGAGVYQQWDFWLADW